MDVGLDEWILANFLSLAICFFRNNIIRTLILAAASVAWSVEMGEHHPFKDAFAHKWNDYM